MDLPVLDGPTQGDLSSSVEPLPFLRLKGKRPGQRSGSTCATTETRAAARPRPSRGTVRTVAEVGADRELWQAFPISHNPTHQK